MSHDEDQGLFYFVSDEALRQFAKSTVAQRLLWLDEMRTFTWNAQTDATRARWRAEREARHGGGSLPASDPLRQAESPLEPNDDQVGDVAGVEP
jgi:hypothetical protein